MMSVSPSSPSRQVESQVSESSNQAFAVLEMKVPEIDKEDVCCNRIGHREKDLKKKRKPTCVEDRWCLLNTISFNVGFFSLYSCAARPTPNIYKIIFRTLIVIPVFLGGPLFSIFMQKKYLGMPDRLIGRVWRIVGDEVALVAALILREAFPYIGSDTSKSLNIGKASRNINAATKALVVITLNIHSWLQVLHRAGDISFADVLLEMIVQAAIYISTGHDIVCVCIALFFCGVMCYKYISYSVRISIEDKNKDVEMLPCPV